MSTYSIPRLCYPILSLFLHVSYPSPWLCYAILFPFYFHSISVFLSYSMVFAIPFYFPSFLSSISIVLSGSTLCYDILFRISSFLPVFCIIPFYFYVILFYFPYFYPVPPSSTSFLHIPIFPSISIATLFFLFLP